MIAIQNVNKEPLIPIVLYKPPSTRIPSTSAKAEK